MAVKSYGMLPDMNFLHSLMPILIAEPTMINEEKIKSNIAKIEHQFATVYLLFPHVL